VEATTGQLAASGFDWCDRLQEVAGRAAPAAEGSIAGVASGLSTVLVIRLGTLVEAIVVEDGTPRADPVTATDALAAAADDATAAVPADALAATVRAVSPLVRDRLAVVAASRVRTADRGVLCWRWIPWSLSAALRG